MSKVRHPKSTHCDSINCEMTFENCKEGWKKVTSEPLTTTNIEDQKSIEESLKKEKPVESKSWEELTDTQKIERMKMYVKSSQYSITQLKREIEQLKQLYKHEHLNGKLVMEIKEQTILDRLYGGVGIGVTNIENYF